MTIRARLALWYSGLLTLLIIIFSIAVITTSRITILRTIDQVLKSASQEIQSNITLVPVGEFGPPEPEIRFRSDDIFSAPGVSVQIWRTHRNGSLLEEPILLRASNDVTAQQDQHPLDPNSVGLTNNSIYVTTTINGLPERVASFPFGLQNGTPVGMIQVATPVRAVEQSNDILLGVIVVGAAISIIVSIGLGMWVSGRLLEPIENIRQAAASIADADDLSTRLEWTGPPDELGRLTEVFNHMMMRLEHLFSVQERFIGDVSHELRTPLTSILGNLELINMYGEQPDSLEIVHREAKRMARMVDDLLLLTRADFGEMQVDFYPVDLDTVVLEVYEQAMMLKKKRQLTIRLGKTEPVRIHGNSDRIRQLLLNLVSNAIKFTGDGGKIELSVYPEDNTHAVLEVSDTGIGISDEHKALIFDRFFQADPSRTIVKDEDDENDLHGVGLGLSIASWIINIHGGSIEVESKLGEGTTFRVRLPIEPDTPSSDETHTPTPKKSTPVKIKRRSKRDATSYKKPFDAHTLSVPLP